MTIIAFISQKGGVGKSTLAQALAVEAHKKKVKVLLADCDSQQTTSYEWSKITGKIPCQVFNSVKEVWPLAKQYQLIIIDAPARTSQGTLEIAKQANLIIQPTGASRADLAPAVKEFNALVKAGVSKKKLLFVLNRIGSKAEGEIAQGYLKDTGYFYLPISLPEKVSFRSVQNEGKAITEIPYKTLRKQTKKLVEGILDYI
ncbi:ParA family protein [endosymbiont GvMRE of Glomus versiforme]|uniref:ParA family protein n=1 Tax=endosymbiont GvMRE of Glomus versiforme TaxID=2039283 RepID=UPI000EDD1F6B|nr:ParA family protein [endosymbiont GvMRE of Glomus versiforme]RHZ35940.1 ParA-like protein [endosymbiont GvMRE of Glomus versiforme]